MEQDLERVLLTKAEIDAIICSLGRQIHDDYAGQDLLVVGVLNGAVFVTADLVRAIDMDCQLDFVGVSSYGNGAVSGDLSMTKAPSISPQGKSVLLVEDVLDTGRTLSHLMAYYRDLGAASVKLCAFLDKPSSHLVDLSADYVGREVGSEFLVGYGLDYAQRYRNLPCVGVLKPELYQ